jgi:hypothetical protein
MSVVVTLLGEKRTSAVDVTGLQPRYPDMLGRDGPVAFQRVLNHPSLMMCSHQKLWPRILANRKLFRSISVLGAAKSPRERHVSIRDGISPLFSAVRRFHPVALSAPLGPVYADGPEFFCRSPSKARPTAFLRCYLCDQ